MDTSWSMYSSMSPKVIVSSKIKNQKGVLALKKSLRKSIAIDKRKSFKAPSNTSIEIISSSCTSSTNSMTNMKDMKEAVIVHNTVIEISDTEESVIDETKLKIINRKSLNKIELSEENNYTHVLKWLDNVKPFQSEKEEIIENSVILIENSIINNSFSKLDDSFDLNKSLRTRLKEKTENFKNSTLNNRSPSNNEIISETSIDSNKTPEKQDNEISNSSNTSPLPDLNFRYLRQSEVEIKSNFETPKCINPSQLSQIEIDLLNDVYGDTWNKCSKSYTQPKVIRKEKLHFSAEKESSIRSIPKYENSNKIINIQKKTVKKDKKRYFQTEIKKTNKKTPPWVKIITNLCDSDTSSSAASDNDELLDEFKKKLIFSDNSDKEETNDTPKTKSNDAKRNNRRKKKNVKYRISDDEDDSFIDDKENHISSDSSDSEWSDDEIKPKRNIRTKKESKNVTKKTTNNKKNVVRADALQTDKKLDDRKKEYTFLESLSNRVDINKCHKDAYKYRRNFQIFKEDLAIKLFAMYNENVFNNKLPTDVPLEWNPKMLKTAGFCYNRLVKQGTAIVQRSCRIVLSTKVLDSADRLRDTLIHEMCHAAAWIIDEVRDGHGPIWNNWAQKALKTYPELPPIKRCHEYKINTKYTYKCVSCGYCIGRHSKSLDIERKRCGYCHGKFEVFINKIMKNGTAKSVPSTPKAKKELTGFPLFVRENYARVKKPALNHKDVMTILGEQFSAMKVNGNLQK